MKKSIWKNLAKVFFSQGLSVFSGVMVGFIIPKILGVEEYGFYRTYTMYFTYTSLLHFGFVDGILLKYSGQDYDNLNKYKLRALTTFYMIFELIFSILVLLIGITFQDKNYKFMAVMIAINLFITNTTTYYQFISQATQRFSEFALRNVVLSFGRGGIALIGLVVYQYTEKIVSYKYYLAFLTLLELGVLVWYITTYNDITFGKKEKISHIKSDIKMLFKTGIVLTVAYQIGHLILLLDRQFVSIYFDNEIYANYSFAYSIIGLFTTLVASISTVMFPVLKSLTAEQAVGRYETLSRVVIIIAAATLCAYYPISFIIKEMLPEYLQSVWYLKLIIPTLLLSTPISVVGFTFFKVLDQNQKYLNISLLIFVIGVALNFVGLKIVRQPEILAIVSLFTMICWYVAINGFLWCVYKIKFMKEFIYIITVLCAYFFSFFMIRSDIISTVMYFIAFSITFVFFYKRDFGEWVQGIQKK